MGKPKITVIIPTRERPDVLAACLKTVIAQDYDNLDIIVSDNVSRDETEGIVRGTGDPRVKYINPGRRLSMSHHWEFVLSHVSDGWVGLLGDDDGLVPDALGKVATIIDSTGAQAIRSSICNYSWPGISRENCGRISVPLGNGLEQRNSRTWLKLLLDGRVWYTDLPVIYQAGFVDYAVLERIKRRGGQIMLSCIPDVYSGVAIASTVESYVYSFDPFAINGASRHSSGNSMFDTRKATPASPHAKFISEGNIQFHQEIPLLPDGDYPKAISLLVYEAYLQSAALREPSPISMHSQQLVLALASSLIPGANDEWGRLFARQHSLDFEALRSRATWAQLRIRMRNLVNRVHEELTTARVGDAALPLADVYEASIAAGEILRNKPKMTSNLVRAAGRIADKLAQWAAGRIPRSL